jgi:hypothetical protein
MKYPTPALVVTFTRRLYDKEKSCVAVSQERGGALTQAAVHKIDKVTALDDNNRDA